MSDAAEKVVAQEWLAKFLDHHHINWETLTPAQRFLMTREIPCYVRCWRVGGPVDVKPGEVCPECGSPVPKKTAWEMIPLPV